MRASARQRQLDALHAALRVCRRCPTVTPPVVLGNPVLSPIALLGQAPGDKEGPAGRPFAWTAGKTLFRWLESATGADEATVRQRVYFAAVLRCFPGKKPAGGDRAPADEEVMRCREWLAREVALVRPRLVLPVGALAIAQVLGRATPLAEVVGHSQQISWHGQAVDVVPLPHPSGASTWHVTEPGKTLLAKALRRLGKHPVVREVFASREA